MDLYWNWPSIQNSLKIKRLKLRIVFLRTSLETFTLLIELLSQAPNIVIDEERNKVINEVIIESDSISLLMCPRCWIIMTNFYHKPSELSKLLRTFNKASTDPRALIGLINLKLFGGFPTLSLMKIGSM